jgi:putative SOS response-associated peptidase YedK
MCGRYASTRSAADLAALFDAVDETFEPLVPDYNLAPTDAAPIVRLSARTLGTTPVLTVARWGLVPSWAADASGAARMINARAETIATSRAFGRSFAERRCLIPADGWYEWRRTERGKQPYFMNRGAEPVVFGGVWSPWGAGDAHRITFSIVTLAAEGQLAAVHDRMPLVLEPERWRDWLTGPDPAAQLRPAADSFVSGIELRPVSIAVGDVRNDGPELVRAVPASSIVEDEPTLF